LIRFHCFDQPLCGATLEGFADRKSGISDYTTSVSLIQKTSPKFDGREKSGIYFEALLKTLVAERLRRLKQGKKKSQK
jgi:hypothetical protein